MVDSRVYPKLERVPGIQNWVDKAGGLPSYIERIAKHLHYEKGMSISRAIATAVNTVKRWAKMGRVLKHGGIGKGNQHVTPATVAQSIKAVAEWEAKRAAGHIKLSDSLLGFIDMSTVDDEYALLLAEELLDGEGNVLDLAENDTPGQPDTSAANRASARLRPVLKTSEGGMDLQALAERASAIEDPVARSAARQRVLDLAVPPAKLTAPKRRVYAKNGSAMSDGSFPVFDRQSLLSACRLARTPAQRRHIMRRARALGLASAIPSNWSMSLSEMAMEGLLDLASTIPPKNLHGLASDGRRRYTKQGRWKHGFIPVDQAAKESKAKGSPIAIKRLNRLFGGKSAAPSTRTATTSKTTPPPKPSFTAAAKGRVGQRSAPTKNNPKSVVIAEKSLPGSASGQSLGSLSSTDFAATKNRLQTPKNQILPESQKEASKSSRVPNRARQNWDEIPANLKTVRNGQRYVYAEYGGKGFVTPWVGGVHTPSSTPLAKRKVYRTLSTATAANMDEPSLRDIVNNPKSSPQAKTVARKYLKAFAVANRTKEASKKP